VAAVKRLLTNSAGEHAASFIPLKRTDARAAPEKHNTD
jgi:hypothetical protein